jgi:P-type conjugative transfer protein TrbJ
MRVRRVLLGIMGVSMGLSVLVAHAGMPVFDEVLNAQAILQLRQQIAQYAQIIKQVENEARMIKNQIDQIQHAATTVEHGARNLLKLDFSNAQAVLGLMDQFNGKLAQIEGIEYTLSGAVASARRLYPQVATPMAAADKRALDLQWSGTQREAARVAVETQAILEQQRQTRQQWRDLYEAARTAEGSLQVQQALFQAQALQGAQLGQIEQQLATAGRLQAEKTLKEAAETEIEQARLTKDIAPVSFAHTARGKLLTLDPAKK